MEPLSKKHKYYMQIAETIAKNSKAKRRKVGCIVVKNTNIISFGYNGTPKSFNNKCENSKGETKRSVLHAELNAIVKLAKSSESIVDSDVYITLSPCYECCKLFVQSEINNLYYKEEYRDTSGIKLLKKANINVFKI